MSRTISARIKPEMHEDLRDQCNKIGCSINDFLVACIELELTGHTDFDFGDEESKINQKKKTDKVDEHKGKRPCLHFHLEGDKLVQGETTWEDIGEGTEKKDA